MRRTPWGTILVGEEAGNTGGLFELIDPVSITTMRAADPSLRRLDRCWANTGRKSHTGSSVVENGGVEGEVMCLTENPPSANDPTPVAGTIPTVERFITGSEERAMFDNVAFQPHTGNLVVLEDGPVGVVKSANPLVTELRGNDLWICLPDGKDDDALTDGCARFASIRDTSAEPTGFIFFGSGEEALVSIRHRSVNDALGEANHGASRSLDST